MDCHHVLCKLADDGDTDNDFDVLQHLKKQWNPLSRSLLQCDIHLHKQQSTDNQRGQHGTELGSEHKQRPGHEHGPSQ